MTTLTNWLEKLGLAAANAHAVAVLGALIGMVVLSVMANFVAKRWLLAFIRRGASRTRTQWDDILVRMRVFHRLSHLAPALVVYLMAPFILEDYPRTASLVIRGSEIYMLVIGLLVVDALLNAGLGIYRTYEVSRQVPVKGFIQVIKLLLYFLGGVLILSAVLGQTPVYFLSGMGAMTAVLMLIFKDPILGFVAGIQLSGNRMVAVGDWIEMPKYGADGDVLEIALTTVKVQNWDKTITTIPTYALISESFKNWRGMSESGGRRIKRAVCLDMQTVRFCTAEMLTRFRRIQFISEYLERKAAEVDAWNQEHAVDPAALANGRRLTNLGTFRAYVESYLRHHPMIHEGMTFLVRQLAPTAHGLPIEIYVFSKDQRWVNYEGIQSDIFDHILAVVPEFDLRVFQEPSGNDLRWLGSRDLATSRVLPPPRDGA
ncbi:MAG: mechanosensitive ion channel [Verrucomicrobiales bacterium]|nr:mechanosensitive ion channel [Verrucomicrobiales bacterium]